MYVFILNELNSIMNKVYTSFYSKFSSEHKKIFKIIYPIISKVIANKMIKGIEVRCTLKFGTFLNINLDLCH